MQITIYALVFLVSSIICFYLSYYSFQRKEVLGARELAYLLLAAGVWVFFVFLEASAETVALKIFWSKIAYFGATTTPVLYYLFVLKFTGNLFIKRPLQKFYLFLNPIITLIFTFTNEYHNLVWTGYSGIDPSSNIMKYYHGFWFWIGYFCYSYIMLFLATLYLIGYIRKYKHGFRMNGWLVVMAGFFPWLASLMYVTDINIVPGLDLTPLFILFSGIFFFFGFMRSQLLDLTPVAREALVETLPDGIIALDQLDRIQDINDRAIESMSINRDSYMGRRLQDATDKNTPLVEAVLSDENPVLIEISDSEKIKTFKIIKQPLKNSKGSRLIVIRDITEILESQSKLISAEMNYKSMYQMFRLMSDNMSDMVWAKDLDKRYIFVNKSLIEKILILEDTEIAIGKTLTEIMDYHNQNNSNKIDLVDYVSQGEATDTIVMETGRPLNFDENIDIDGVERYLDIRKAPIFNEDGEMIGVVGSARDITAQKVFEKKLLEAKIKAEDSDRFKSSFLANMSHEIRTPMNSILGFISILEEDNISTNERREYLSIMRSSGERLMNTINDVIDISKIESGQMKVTLSEFNVNDLIYYIYNMFYREAEIRGLKFEKPMLISPEKAIIVTDKEKLYSITTNLVKNALKFTPEGYVEFDLNLDNNNFNFYVKDSGVGISKDKIDKVFDRFSYTNDKDKTKVESSGLGLSITKAYCELLEGKVWCESKENEGSIFYVELPLKKKKNKFVS